MKQSLFFLRHYNDIDHIVPVIHKWSVSGNSSTVILLGFSDLTGDYRIKHLSSLPRTRILPLSDLLSPFDIRKFRLFSLALYGRANKHIGDRIFRIFELLWPYSIRQQFWQRISTKILGKVYDKEDQGSVVFDWISKNSTLPVEFVQHFVAQARACGHTAVSLPHGDSPHYNKLIRNNELRPENPEKLSDSDIFDYVVCPNELCAQRYRSYLPDSKIKVLGSARYSEEWLDILRGLLPPQPLTRGSDKLHVVLFLRKKEFSLFWDEVERVIRMIEGMEDIHLVIKPHTRDYLQQPLKHILRRTRSPSIEVADNEIHSASLLEWADVVIDIATSVAFEAVRRNIPVLAADYLHAGYSAVAWYIPETAVHYRDQLYEALVRLRSDADCRYYNNEHRNSFLNAMLDVPDKQVLERYVCLLSGSEQTQETQGSILQAAQ